MRNRCSFMSSYYNDYYNYSKEYLLVKPFQLTPHKFQCFKCDFQTTNFDNVHNHFLSDSTFIDNFFLVCDNCQFETNDFENFKEHFENSQHINWVLTVFDSEYSSNIHKIDTASFKCYICQIWLCSFKNLRSHFKLVHLSSKNILQPIQMKIHLDTTLNAAIPTKISKINTSCIYRCYKCTNSKKYRYKLSIKRHFIAAHIQEKFNEDQVIIEEETDDLEIKCTKCSFRCRSSGYFQIHFKKEHNNKILRCDHCLAFWTFEVSRYVEHCKSMGHKMRLMGRNFFENEIKGNKEPITRFCIIHDIHIGLF